MKKKYRYNLNEVYGSFGYSDRDFIRNYIENLRCSVCDEVDFDSILNWGEDPARNITCSKCQIKIDRQTKIDNLLK